MSRYIQTSKHSTFSKTINAPTPPPTASASALGETEPDRRVGEFSSPDDVCPVCKTDRYLKPNLRLMVSFCYHKMCESCMDRIFSLGPEPCPICGVRIRKAQFKPQLFESLDVQKEVNIRKRTSKIFNKRAEDFADLKAYNDYLETFEDLTFNLIHSQDIEATEAKIRQYELENRALIESNLSRAELESELLKKREEEEQKVKLENKLVWELMDEEERLAKEEEKRMVLLNLESSTASTNSILSAARSSALKRSTARSSTLLSSLPSSTLSLLLSGLPSSSEQEEEAEEDIFAELNKWDDYHSMYHLKSRKEGGYVTLAEATVGDEGGFKVEETWEKVIRAGVMELWLDPVE